MVETVKGDFRGFFFVFCFFFEGQDELLTECGEGSLDCLLFRMSRCLSLIQISGRLLGDNFYQKYYWKDFFQWSVDSKAMFSVCKDGITV